LGIEDTLYDTNPAKINLSIGSFKPMFGAEIIRLLPHSSGYQNDRYNYEIQWKKPH